MVDRLWSLRFPGLQVLAVDHPPTDARSAFTFIDQHSTLMEVNVSSVLSCVRLEALLALIDDTGTWSSESYPRAYRSQITSEEYDPENPIPPTISDWLFHLSKFAFVRAPNILATANCSDSASSLGPRYHCTALSFELLYNSRDWESISDYQPTITDLLGSLSDYSAAIEELQVSCAGDMPQFLTSAVIPYMVSIPISGSCPDE